MVLGVVSGGPWRILFLGVAGVVVLGTVAASLLQLREQGAKWPMFALAYLVVWPAIVFAPSGGVRDAVAGALSVALYGAVIWAVGRRVARRPRVGPDHRGSR
jgi:hypothetical protein